MPSQVEQNENLMGANMKHEERVEVIISITPQFSRRFTVATRRDV